MFTSIPISTHPTHKHHTPPTHTSYIQVHTHPTHTHPISRGTHTHTHPISRIHTCQLLRTWALQLYRVQQEPPWQQGHGSTPSMDTLFLIGCHVILQHLKCSHTRLSPAASVLCASEPPGVCVCCVQASSQVCYVRCASELPGVCVCGVCQ